MRLSGALLIRDLVYNMEVGFRPRQIQLLDVGLISNRYSRRMALDA